MQETPEPKPWDEMVAGAVVLVVFFGMIAGAFALLLWELHD